MEQPGLLGPRNETIEEIAGPVGGLSYEQRDRPLWQANDDKSGRPSEMSKDVENVGPFRESGEDEDVGPFGETRDEEEVGPFGETRDEEDVGPFGETRDEDDGLRQDYDDGEQQEEEEEEEGEEEEEEEGEEEEEEVTEAEVMNNLVQLAKKTAGILSDLLANTGAASSSTTSSTTSSTEPGASLTSSSHTLSSTPPTTSRKRTRDSEEDAMDEESPSQQKRRRMDGIKRTSPSQQTRRRMDDVLGIPRKDTNAASNLQSIGAAMTPDVQQSKKRTRDSEEDAMDEESPSQQKRRRMDGIKRTSPSQQTRRRMDDVLGIPRKDTNATSNPQSVGAAVTPDVQQSRKRARSSDDNSEESTTRPGPKRLRLFVQPRDDANDEAAPSQKEWNTAHGINSNGANIRVRGMKVYDLTGEEADFYLPTPRTSSPCRPLTEKEKEDLRVYIQDYGVQDWKVLAKSMKRPVRELQTEYLEYIIARNIQAGRRKKAGIPSAYPNLAPPPPPPPLPKPDEPTAAPDSADPAAKSESTKAAAASEPAEPIAAPEPAEPIAAPEPAKSNTSVMAPKLRPRAKTGKAKNNTLGDLTYDLKAKSFPRVTKDGGMVDARGNALLGIMGKIPASIY